MINNGTEFTVANSGNINAEGLNMTNNAGEFTINGNVTNNGTGNYENRGTGFNINGTVNNTGDSVFYNEGANGLNVNGTGNSYKRWYITSNK